MSHALTPPAALGTAADAADSVLLWAEDAARRLLAHDRAFRAGEVLQRVACGGAALRFTLLGADHRCALLQVVEASSTGMRCVSVHVPADLAGELRPVLAALHRMVSVAHSIAGESAGLVFRVELSGRFARLAAIGPDGSVLMRAVCLREGPGMGARPTIH